MVRSAAGYNWLALARLASQTNPPELGILDVEIKKVPKGRYILLPITDLTTGHGTHSNPAIRGSYLLELLALSDKPQ